MPVVAPLPTGNNVGGSNGVRVAVDRVLDLQAKRNDYFLAVATVNGPQATYLCTSTWTYPPGWPSIDINIGESGSALATYFCNGGGGLAEIGIYIDGSGPFFPGQPIGVLQAIVTGQSPGWHQFQLWCGNDPNLYPQSYPYMIVWPL